MRWESCETTSEGARLHRVHRPLEGHWLILRWGVTKSGLCFLGTGLRIDYRAISVGRKKKKDNLGGSNFFKKRVV